MTDPPGTTEERLRQVTIGELRPHSAPIVLAEYDPTWPSLFEREAERIRRALGERAVRIEHVGSTSVPGLVAKPIIDVLLVVRSSAEEASYVPALEGAGYLLRIREPDWHEHRLLKGPDTAVNLHVFSEGSSEIERVLTLRDWLRHHDADRELYAETKRNLAGQSWKFVQDYADAKTSVIEGILLRARGGSHSELRQPR
jgi:GrpB-like predicted nucleotidyltransferase (UPF0157 family)